MRLSSPITVVTLATLAMVLWACDPQTPESATGPAVEQDTAADEQVAEEPVAADIAPASLDMPLAEPSPAAEADPIVEPDPADPVPVDEPALSTSTESDDESVDSSSSPLFGPVWPSKEVVLNPALDGILKDVLVEESEAVEKDEVLVQMDDAMQALMVNTADLRAQEAKAQKDAKDEAPEGYVTKVELRQADLAYKIALAEKAIQEFRLEQYKVKAPFKGRIVLIEAVAGATLTLRDPILQMVQVDPLEARLNLPADLRGQLEVGRQYRLAPDKLTRKVLADRGQPTELFGTLKTMAPGNIYAAGTVHCVFTIDNPGGKLHYGFGVRLIWPQ